MTLAGVANLAVNGLVEGAVIALPALALTLVMSIARFPNAATGDLMTLGAYVAVGVQAVLVGSAFGAPLLGMAVATLAAVVACAIVSVAAYELIFRRLGRAAMVASLLASIGLAFLIRSLITLVVGHEQHTFALPLVRRRGTSAGCGCCPPTSRSAPSRWWCWPPSSRGCISGAAGGFCAPSPTTRTWRGCRASARSG